MALSGGCVAASLAPPLTPARAPPLMRLCLMTSLKVGFGVMEVYILSKESRHSPLAKNSKHCTSFGAPSSDRSVVSPSRHHHDYNDVDMMTMRTNPPLLCEAYRPALPWSRLRGREGIGSAGRSRGSAHQGL
jgi:hypothetical protein